MKILTFVFFLIGIEAFSQSNTAFNSGVVGKCGVWGYPLTLYNNASTTHNINDGVTVTVDQNRSSGVVILNGNGAMDLSGSNGITFSGSGSEINCRWDINMSQNGNIVNNDGQLQLINRNLGAFFTIPYAGNYFWQRGSGWGAVTSGSFHNGSIILRKGSVISSIFFQNEAGSCGLAPGQGPVTAPTWENGFSLANSNVGDILYYEVGTAYGNTCNNTRLDYTIGNAMVVYDN